MKLLLIICALGLVLTGCDKPTPPPVADISPTDLDQSEPSEVGRFKIVEKKFEDTTLVMLDTETGDLYGLGYTTNASPNSFSGKEWMKIPSPIHKRDIFAEMMTNSAAK